MLVLTRKMNESILIDGRIQVQIVGIQGERVRIGITAPDDVAIIRSEIVDREEISLDRETRFATV